MNNRPDNPMTHHKHSEGAGAGPDTSSASFSDESPEVTAREAAKITGRTTRTLSNWAANGLITEYRRLPNGSLSFPRASFMKWWDSFLVRQEEDDAKAS